MELGLSIVLQLTLFLFYTADGFSISFATPSLRSRIRLITSTDLKRHTISNDYFKAASDEILHALNGMQDHDLQSSQTKEPIRRRSVSALAKDPNAPLLITMHDTAVARKAGSIVSLDISSLTDIAVFMVIIKSNNRLHNRAIAYHIDVSKMANNSRFFMFILDYSLA
jgi:hypothetical protein